MKFRRYFILELKRSLRLRTYIILLICIFISNLFLLKGVIEYKKILIDKDTFRETEELKVNEFLNYTQYGTYGIRLHLIPSPFSVLVLSSPVNITAYFDSGERLTINKSMKEKDMISSSIKIPDTAEILFIIGSLIAILYGFDRFRHHGFLKLKTCFSRKCLVFIYTYLSNLIILLAFLSIIVLSVLINAALNKVSIFDVNLICFVILFYLVMMFFFSSGAFIGLIKKRSCKIIALFSFYILFAIALNWIILITVEKESLSIYELERKNVKIMMGFERKSYGEIGYWKSKAGTKAPDNVRKIAESGLNNEHKEIKGNEDSFREKQTKRDRLARFILSFNPSSYIKIVSMSLSGLSDEDKNDFYIYAENMKQGYLRFFVQKKFNEVITDGVESFIQKDENLFYSKSRLPDSFLLGLIMLLFYNLSSLLLAYVKFDRTVFTNLDKRYDMRGLKVNIGPGCYHYAASYLYGDEYYEFKSQVENYFFQRKGTEIEIETEININVMVGINPREIPDDIRVNDLIEFILGKDAIVEGSSKKIAQLSDLQAELLLIRIGRAAGKNVFFLDEYFPHKAYVQMQYLKLQNNELQQVQEEIINIIERGGSVILFREIPYGFPAPDDTILVSKDTDQRLILTKNSDFL